MSYHLLADLYKVSRVSLKYQTRTDCIINVKGILFTTENYLDVIVGDLLFCENHYAKTVYKIQPQIVKITTVVCVVFESLCQAAS